jgi:hypothetical protein
MRRLAVRPRFDRRRSRPRAHDCLPGTAATIDRTLLGVIPFPAPRNQQLHLPGKLRVRQTPPLATTEVSAFASPTASHPRLSPLGLMTGLRFQNPASHAADKE